MGSYDSSGLKDTLIAIKDRFGTEALLDGKKLISIFSDFAPELKNERGMLDRISRAGIMKEFAAAAASDENARRRAFFKARERLVRSEYIMQDIAEGYLGALASVFGWNFDPEADVPPSERTEAAPPGTADGGEESAYDLYQRARGLLEPAGDGRCRDAAKGTELLNRSAENGCVQAQVLLAKICLSGTFADKPDIAMFVYWIRKAAEQGSAEAQRTLGQAYIRLNDPAVLPKSYSSAAEWLSKAAAQGDIQSRLILVELYIEDGGLAKDPYKAVSHLMRAEKMMAEREGAGENMAAEHKRIADIYFDGLSDIDHYRAKAFGHYCKAFSAGDRTVLYRLGMCYKNGWGVKKNRAKAKELLRQAADAGDIRAAEELKRFIF